MYKMYKKKLLCLLLALLLFTIPNTSFAGCFLIFCKLDTEGQGASWTCGLDTLNGHTIAPYKHTYKFKSSCSASQVSKAWNFSIVTTGEWNSDGSTVQKSVGSNPAFTATVTANCKVDPWAYPGTACTNKQFHYSVPSSAANDGEYQVFQSQLEEYTKDPFPMTAGRLSAVQRQQIVTEINQTIPVPGAPLVTLPATDGKAVLYGMNLAVQIKHNNAVGLAWMVQYRPDATQPWETVPNTEPWLKNQTTANGITSGAFNYTKPGQWRFQVVSIFPGAQPSAWRSFSVIKLTPKHKL